MKSYDVLFSNKAKKVLKKMDRQEAIMLMSWIKKNLLETQNPRLHGKALTGDFSNYWRYRVGSYRLITEIVDSELIIHMINIGHRKDIYKK